MKQKGFALIIIVIVIALVAVAGAYIAGNKGLLNKLPKISVSLPSPTPVSTPDPTKDWKTYTNTKYNYLFKYPTDYSVSTNGWDYGKPEVEAGVVVNDTKTEDPLHSPRLSVSVNFSLGSLKEQAEKHFNKITFNNWSEAGKQDLSRTVGEIQDNQIIDKFTETTFLGTKAYTYVIKGNVVNDGSSEYVAPLREYKYIWFQNGQNVFLITTSNITLLDQILSTFKFTE